MRVILRSCLLGLALQPAQTLAADSVLLETGRSFTRDHSIEITRLGFTWDWRRQWSLTERWNLGGYWETSVGHWRGGGRLAPHETWDFAAGPVLRLSGVGGSGFQPYAEAGLGLHWLSNRRFSDSMRSGTQAQFGLTLGPPAAETAVGGVHGHARLVGFLPVALHLGLVLGDPALAV